MKRKIWHLPYEEVPFEGRVCIVELYQDNIGDREFDLVTMRFGRMYCWKSYSGNREYTHNCVKRWAHITDILNIDNEEGKQE